MPVNTLFTACFIYYVSTFGRASASIQQAVTASISEINPANHLTKPGECVIQRGIVRSGGIRDGLSSGHINPIYKRLVQQAGLYADLITRISGHSLRIRATKDLLACRVSMPTVIQQGRRTNSYVLICYLEKPGFVE